MGTPVITRVTLSGPSLKDPKLKMGRAKAHLDALNTELTRFIQRKPYKLTGRDDLKNQRYVVRIQFEKAPVITALLVGDFVNCVRSALDQLAFQLALLTARSPNRPGFPICDAPKCFRQAKSKGGVIFEVPADAGTVIESLQPYYGGAALQDSFLWQLHRLWNIDKHNVIPIHSTTFYAKFPYEGAPIKGMSFDDYYEVYLPLSAKEKMDLHPTIPMEIIFGQWNSGFEVPSGRMAEIYTFVRDGVIPRFASFFP
ncbi:MAG TPA: hypothetical protein VI451_06190 [Anaerolineales bacterium]|nr:hypothetical protein [Anaerolineales bacterium]